MHLKNTLRDESIFCYYQYHANVWKKLLHIGRSAIRLAYYYLI